MKKSIIRFLGIAVIATILAACGKSADFKANQIINSSDSKVTQVIQNQIQETYDYTEQNKKNKEPISKTDSERTEKVLKENSNNDVDIDLTKLSSTMVYSEVYDMMYVPERYIGKTVRMQGQFVIYTNMLVKLVQRQNALSLILVTLFGIVMLVKFGQP